MFLYYLFRISCWMIGGWSKCSIDGRERKILGSHGVVDICGIVLGEYRNCIARVGQNAVLVTKQSDDGPAKIKSTSCDFRVFIKTLVYFQLTTNVASIFWERLSHKH